MLMHAKLYWLIIFCTSLSILFYHRRIFGVNGTSRRLFTAVIVLQVLLAIRGVRIETVSCSPIGSKLLSLLHVCNYYRRYLIVFLGLDWLLNALIRVLPIDGISRRKSWKEKCWITLILLVRILYL